MAKCKTALLLGWLSTGSDQARPRAALHSVLPFELCWRRWFCQLQSADKFRQTLDRFPNKTFHALRQPIASTEIPIASDARPLHTSRGFLPWRFAYAGPVCAAPPSWGRHPKTFTIPDSCTATKFVLFATSLPRLSIGCAITGLIATAVSNHADVWSNADSWVAKPSQAVQYRRD